MAIPSVSTEHPLAGHRLRLAILSEIPTPYRMPIFAEMDRHPDLDCHFFFCSLSQQDRDWKVPISTLRNCEVLKGFQFQKTGKNTLTTFVNPRVVTRFWKGRFDLAIIGGWSQPTMILAILVCLIKRIPYVLHSESHGLKKRPKWKQWLAKVYPGKFLKNSNGCLVTGTLAERHASKLGAKATYIFPNACDTEFFETESDRLSAKKSELGHKHKIPTSHHFLYAGRLVGIKGLDDLLDAFEIIEAAIPEWSLVMVGSGPDAAKLMARTRNSSWQDRFIMLDAVPPEELVEQYVAADVFVLPSLQEPWGVVVQEAMACGLPVIASLDVGSAADLLGHELQSQLFETGNAQDLARAMWHLANNAQARRHSARISLDTAKAWGYNKNLDGLNKLFKAMFPNRFQNEWCVNDHTVA